MNAHRCPSQNANGQRSPIDEAVWRLNVSLAISAHCYSVTGHILVCTVVHGGPRYLSRYSDSLTSLTVQGSNPGGGVIFRTRPDRPGAHSASCTMGTGSFRGVKRPEGGINHPPPSSAEVEGRVQLYICSSSGPSGPFLGRTFTVVHGR